MDKRRITIIAVAGAIILALIVLGILYFSFLSRSTAKVVLADITSGEKQTEDPDGKYEDSIVQVSAETVPDIIAVLKRPDNYHIRTDVTVQFDGTAATVTGNLWVDGGVSLVAMGQIDGTIKNTVSDGEKVYIWYSDATERVFEGVKGNFSDDDAMMMYTYEDIVYADRKTVTDAGYEKVDGESCIYAVLDKGTIQTKLWVSTQSGVLIKAERSIDGETVYTMKVTLFEENTVGDDVFVLPDGRKITE